MSDKKRITKGQLFKDLIYILEPSKYQTRFFEYCKNYAEKILDEVGEEEETYEISGFDTKKKIPVIIDLIINY